MQVRILPFTFTTAAQPQELLMQPKQIDDGGPAYPASVKVGDLNWNQGSIVVAPVSGESVGMSLRDHFAGQFAAAWLIVLGGRQKLTPFSDTDAMGEANRLGLKQADDMIAQRKAGAQ